MKICVSQLKKFSTQLFLVFAMLLVGAFITNTSANASAGLVINSDVSNSGTVTAGNNQIMICTGNLYSRNNDNFYPTWNGQAMTPFKSGISTCSNQDFFKDFYLVNPSVGTYTLNWNYSGYTIWGFSCYVLENIDQTNPVTYVSDYKTNFVDTYTSTSSQNAVILDFSVTTNSSLGIDNSWSSLWQRGGDGYCNTARSLQSKNITSNGQATLNASASGSFYFVELRSSNQTPPFSGYLSYTGSNPSYTAESTYFNLPYSYNVCDGYDSDYYYFVGLSDWSNSADKWKILPSCSASLYYYNAVGAGEYLQNSEKFQIYKQLKTDGSSFNPELSTLVVESDPFINVIYTPISSDSRVWAIGGSTYYLDSNNATNTIAVGYDLCGGASVATSSKICLTSTAGGNNTPSNTCSDYLTSCGGLISIVVPTPDNANSLTSLSFRFDVVDDSSTILKGDYFWIKWLSNLSDSYSPPDIIASSSLVYNMFPTSTKYMACTQDEWDFAASSTAIINISGLKCSALKATYDFANSLRAVFISIFQYLADGLSNIFPFNIPFHVKQAYDEAKSAPISSELTFASVDSNNNLHLSFPASWNGTNSDLDIIVFGPALWSDNSALVSFFQFIRTFSTVLLGWWFINTMFSAGGSILELSVAKNKNGKFKYDV